MNKILKLNILVIEDNPDNTNILLQELRADQNLNIAIHNVLRIKQALRILSEKQFDVILLNLNLPDSQGIESFDLLRSNFHHIPVIVITDSAALLQSKALLSGGVQDIINRSKLNSEDLIKSIVFAIERQKLQQEVLEIQKLESEVQKMRITNQVSATLAHEFNTPLAVISGSLDIMNMLQEIDEDMQIHFERIKRQVNRMSVLIDQLSNLQEFRELDYASGLKILDINANLGHSKDRLKQLSSDLSER